MVPIVGLSDEHDASCPGTNERSCDRRLKVGASLDKWGRTSPKGKHMDVRDNRVEFAPAGYSACNFKLQFSRIEAAHLLGQSLRQVDRLIALKQLRVRRDGRRVFVTRQAIEQFLRTDSSRTR